MKTQTRSVYIIILFSWPHSYANPNNQTVECQYLERVHCNNCPAPLVFNCGGSVRFVKPDTKPRKVFIKVTDSQSVGRDRSPIDLAWNNIKKISNNQSSNNFHLLLGIDVDSRSKAPMETMGELTNSQNQEGIRWIKQKIVEKAPKLSESQLTYRGSSWSNSLAYNEAIDNEESGFTGIFHLSSEDLYRNKENFCWYGSLPTIIGFSKHKIICPKGQMKTNRFDRAMCGKNDRNWKKETNPCHKRRKVCFGQVKCVMNGQYKESYAVCAANDNACPMAEQCMEQSKKIENLHPKNLKRLSLYTRDTPLNGTNFSSYTSQPQVIPPPSNFIDTVKEFFNDSSLSCNICVAPVHLGKVSAKAVGACSAYGLNYDHCPPPDECLNGGDYVNTMNPSNAYGLEGVRELSVIKPGPQVQSTVDRVRRHRSSSSGVIQ